MSLKYIGNDGEKVSFAHLEYFANVPSGGDFVKYSLLCHRL